MPAQEYVRISKTGLVPRGLLADAPEPRPLFVARVEVAERRARDAAPKPSAIEQKLAELARSPEWYIREHVAAIRRARKYMKNRSQHPRYGLGWSRNLAMQALRNAAQLRRALADLRAPQTIWVVV